MIDNKFPITTQLQPNVRMGPSMGLELIQVIRMEDNRKDRFCLDMWNNLSDWIQWLDTDTIRQRNGNVIYVEVWLVTANSPDRVLIAKWQNPWSGTITVVEPLSEETEKLGLELGSP